MKNFISILFIFVSIGAYSQVKGHAIDYDFSKAEKIYMFAYSYLGEDGGIIESDNQSILFTLKHKDYGSAGNIHNVDIVLKGDKNIILSARLKDVKIVKKFIGEEVAYCVEDSDGGRVYLLNVEKGRNVLIVYNFAYFEKK